MNNYPRKFKSPSSFYFAFYFLFLTTKALITNLVLFGRHYLRAKVISQDLLKLQHPINFLLREFLTLTPQLAEARIKSIFFKLKCAILPLHS